MKRFAFSVPLFFLFPFFSLAQPKGVHLSWGGGGSVNTATGISITWLNDKAGQGSVQYGTDSSRLTKEKKGAVLYSSNLSAYVSKASLKELRPATEYYYRVGSDAGGWSNIFHFRTGPAKGDVSKILVGIWSDTQNNGG